MKFIYKPTDGEKREWEFEPSRMTSLDAEAIESVTGWTFSEFGEKFLKGSTMAQHALLWVLLRHENHGLKYRQVQFRMDEIDTVFDQEELDSLRKAAEDPETDLTDEEREQMLDAVRTAEKALAEQDDPDDPSEDPENPTVEPAVKPGLALSPPSDSATNRPSPTPSD